MNMKDGFRVYVSAGDSTIWSREVEALTKAEALRKGREIFADTDLNIASNFWEGEECRIRMGVTTCNIIEEEDY